MYTGQWRLSPLQRRHFGTSQSSPNCHQLLHRIFLNLTNSLKVILVLGKARSCRAPSLGCRRVESPGWFDISPKNSAPDMMHEQACCHDEAANHQLPTAVAFWSIWSFHRGMFKLNTKFDADSLLYSLSHFECNSYTVHMLTQWCLLPSLTSAVKSSLFIHAHSSPLSLAARLCWCFVNCSYHINNGWTFFQIDLIYLIRFI